MKNAKYLLVPVVVTLMVLVVSLYPPANVTRKASAAPRSAVVAKYLMMPAAAFQVTEAGKDYYNYGYFLGFSSGIGSFVAPVYLPAGARIRSIKLFAFDSSPGFNLCAWLYESRPQDGGWAGIASVCTKGSSGRQQPVKRLSHYVKWYYGYYITLEFPVSTDLTSYDVMIRYTVNQ
jgi:hypothetical protein